MKKITARKRLVLAEGGTSPGAWREEKKKTGLLVKERKRGCMETQKGHILEEDANKKIFRHVKSFSSLERPKQFDVRELYDGMTDMEIAEDLAVYFVQVSREFSPLEPEQTLITKGISLPRLQNFEVTTRIKKFRKPKLMVPGNVFPKLVAEMADFLLFL